MIMIAIFTLIDTEMSVDMVVILSDASGELGLFTGGIANFMLVPHPATFRLVCPIR